MKKIVSFTVAIGLMASIAATASAAEVTGTVSNPSTISENAYSEPFESLITPTDIRLATPQIILTTNTPFHLSANSIKPDGWLSPQILDTTGEVMVDTWGNEWREIYTWLGKAWIKVPVTANVTLS